MQDAASQKVRIAGPNYTELVENCEHAGFDGLHDSTNKFATFALPSSVICTVEEQHSNQRLHNTNCLHLSPTNWGMKARPEMNDSENKWQGHSGSSAWAGPYR